MNKPRHLSKAVVTLRNPAKLTTEQKKEISLWLRRQAYHLLKNGEKYADNFVVRYE